MDKNKISNEELNKKIGERLKKAIKRKGLTQAEFAKRHANFTQQYISNICKGSKYIGDANAYRFAKLLGVRPEYLLCIDDYMTEDEITKEKKDAFLCSIGSIAENKENIGSKFDRLDRVISLYEISKQLEEIYDVPVNWDELPLGSSLEFYSFIDEQLEHAFKTYFKYFSSSIKDDDSKYSSALDGLSVIIQESIDATKKIYPDGTTTEQFFQSLKSEDKVSKLKKEIKNVIRKEETQ